MIDSDTLDQWREDVEALACAIEGERVFLALLDEVAALQSIVGTIAVILADTPTCDKYDGTGIITCGWKRTVQNIRATLNSTENEER